MTDLTPSPARRSVYLLPNLFTTGALFAGFYSIIASSQGLVEHACIAIFIAAILDGLDGRVARLTNTQSEFGVQYDSLSDLISFGMAPALLVYHWALESLRDQGATAGKLGWLAAFLYAACAALRLARFNSQVKAVDKRWFIGLASPAAAAVLASFVWTCHGMGWIDGDALSMPVLGLTVVVALLMVSRVRYTSFKGGGAGPRYESVPFIMLVVVVIALIALARETARTLLCVFGLYALSGPVTMLVRRRPGAQA